MLVSGTVIDPLYWDDAYPIALALKIAHPGVDPMDVELSVLHEWVVALRDFADEPQVMRIEWLDQIQAEWIELM